MIQSNRDFVKITIVIGLFPLHVFNLANIRVRAIICRGSSIKKKLIVRASHGRYDTLNYLKLTLNSAENVYAEGGMKAYFMHVTNLNGRSVHTSCLATIISDQ